MPILGFEIEWYDSISGLLHKLFLKYWTDDNTIEILTDKSAFLKRIYFPEVKLQDLYIGNTLSIHHRLYTIAKHANKATKEFLEDHEVRYLCVLPSQSMKRGLSAVCAAAKKHSLSLQHFFTTSTEQALHLDEGVVMVYPGDTVVELVGIQIESTAKFHKEQLGNMHDVVVTPISSSQVKDTLKGFSGLEINLPCTLCLIKPHVLKAYKAGDVLQAIMDEGFDIFALFSTHLTLSMAEELFTSYRGIVADYSAVIDSMCAGPVLAVAVTHPRLHDGGEVVTRFRDFAGPLNPALGKVLRPESLRARFGENAQYNAVHVTDLPEDGLMECRYFFEMIANL